MCLAAAAFLKPVTQSLLLDLKVSAESVAVPPRQIGEFQGNALPGGALRSVQ